MIPIIAINLGRDIEGRRGIENRLAEIGLHRVRIPAVDGNRLTLLTRLS